MFSSFSVKDISSNFKKAFSLDFRTDISYSNKYGYSLEDKSKMILFLNQLNSTLIKLERENKELNLELNYKNKKLNETLKMKEQLEATLNDKNTSHNNSLNLKEYLNLTSNSFHILYFYLF